MQEVPKGKLSQIGAPAGPPAHPPKQPASKNNASRPKREGTSGEVDLPWVDGQFG